MVERLTVHPKILVHAFQAETYCSADDLVISEDELNGADYCYERDDMGSDSGLFMSVAGYRRRSESTVYTQARAMLDSGEAINQDAYRCWNNEQAMCASSFF